MKSCETCAHWSITDTSNDGRYRLCAAPLPVRLARPTMPYWTLAPHELRVIEEKRDLDEKLVKLVQFINNTTMFTSLSPIEQELLRLPRSSMVCYSDALCARIACFKDPSK